MNNKFFGVFRTFGHRFPNLIVFPIVLSGHFVMISLMRPFHLVSEIGWLDPWTAVGYGQVFPETPYPWHYYKESRFFSIVYQWFLTHLNNELYLFFQTLTVALCCTLVFFYLQKFSRSSFLCFFASAIVGLSSLLWGESAGGSDYYNMAGNVLLILVLSRILKFRGLDQTGSSLRMNSVVLGFLSYVILIEVPSGIIAVFALQLSFLLSLWSGFSNDIRRFLSDFRRIIVLQVLGIISVLFIQSLVLLVFGKSPIRLLSGPKFLLESVIDPTSLKTWWRNIALIEFIKTDYLKAFSALGFFACVAILLLIALLNSGRARSEQQNLFVFQFCCFIAYLFTWLLLVILQFNTNSLALSVHYFTTPFLFLGLIFCLTFLVSAAHLFPRLRGFPSWIIILTFIWGFVLPVVSPNHPSIVRTENFKECQESRMYFRESVLELANNFDQKFGPRGTLLTAAESNVFEQKIFSNCSSIAGRPLTDVIMSFSQLGFQGVSSLGRIKNEEITAEYSRFYLAEPFNRERLPDRCVLVWNLVEDNVVPENLFITFGGSTLQIKEICPRD